MPQCSHCHASFVISNTDQTFYRSMDVPPPTFCPQCRLKRRLAWRNEHNLYQRQCDLCQRLIISIYRPDSPYSVYCQECWWSDRWEPRAYAQDYVWSKDFFTQYDALRRRVPRVALTNTNSENSEYTNYAGNNKNCYLMFANALGENENCAYGVGSGKCHDCYDTVNVYESELVYDCSDSKQCYRVVGAVNCQNCIESWFMEDCNNCQYCIGCKGLHNKQYCIFNKQLTPEEYRREFTQMQLHTRSGWQTVQNQWRQFRLTQPSRYSHQLKAEHCTGDYITNSAYCSTCFDVNETEHSKFIKFSIGQVRESYDVSYTGTAELGYECLSLVDAYNCRFSNIVWWSVRELQYCELCFYSTDCFGSVGLRKQHYCILNKLYSQTDYAVMVKKIIEQMNSLPYVDATNRMYRYGEFPPPEHSPFTYTESVAEDFFPSVNNQTKTFTESPAALPNSIHDVTDAILQQTIICAPEGGCGKAFKLIAPELAFYRQLGLPLPQYCFNCRHQARLKHKNSVQLWQRQCMCVLPNHSHHAAGSHCVNRFETTYSPDRPELVYCADCYKKEVY